MKQMPDWVKWLVVVLLLAVNDRASRVDMPAPDDTFGFYRSSSEEAAAR